MPILKAAEILWEEQLNAENVLSSQISLTNPPSDEERHQKGLDSPS